METASDDEIVKALELLNNELTTQSQGTTEVAKKEDLTSLEFLVGKALRILILSTVLLMIFTNCFTES